MAYKILVVDDDKDIADTIQARLVKEGYVVTLASDGQEAIEKTKSDDPDILLLDLMLPKLNGFEVLKEIRDNFSGRWRPVIIISAKTEFDSIKECYSLEADHYLVKPCSIESILRGVQTMASLIPLRTGK